MHSRSTVIVVAAGALVATLSVFAPAAAAPPDTLGTPVTTGCPANQVLSVPELLAQGYVLPGRLDEEGNQDGLVCGQPLPAAATEKVCPRATCPVPVIYLFAENDLPARRP